MKTAILILSFVFSVINPVFAQIGGGLSIGSELIEELAKPDSLLVDSAQKNKPIGLIISEYLDFPTLENSTLLKNIFHTSKAIELIDSSIQQRNEQLQKTQNVLKEAKEQLISFRKKNKTGKSLKKIKQIEALIQKLEAKVSNSNLKN